MAQIVTYTEAVSNLKEWVSALQATSSGSSYSIGGRTLTRQDNETIRAEIQRWHNTVTAMESNAAGKSRALGSQAAFPRPGSNSGALISDAIWQDWRT